jgi:hypothetical protein
MEWLVAALTIVFGIVSIALWINYCSVGETDRQNSKRDINPKRSTSTADLDIADEKVAAQLRKEHSLPTRFED